MSSLSHNYRYVILTPFDALPTKRFFLRLAGPTFVVFVLAFLFVGYLSVSIAPSYEGSAIAYYQKINEVFHKMPEVCWTFHTVNDFEKTQCDNFWTELLEASALAAAPFVIALSLLSLAFKNFAATYARTRKKIQKGQVLSGAVVTDPALGPSDRYSWFYCLRPVIVELPTRIQIKVYTSLDTPLPKAGVTLAILEPETAFGEKRHFALLYTPHVAAVRGT